MTAKKGKKKIKVQDLKPKKDAKGGVVLGPVHNPPKGNPPKGNPPGHDMVFFGGLY